MEIQGHFYAPALARSTVPLGISGEGSLRIDGDGLMLKGVRHSRNLSSLFGCVGFFGAFALSIVLVSVLSLPPSKFTGGLTMALSFGGLYGTVALGRKLFPPKPFEHRLSWSEVKSPGIEDGYLTFETTAKPAGQVWFSSSSQGPAALLDLVQQHRS